ncbi:DUF4136 domain-containing protein [Pontibacter anaerobius]|uniref:DUF4136 domain-containing protein n=1 Tax=Pontibacter anaerobius TaxID=2993940 RepID=A0ABT3RCQ4_9BACT|nr:DUF4136 domain-containing protein [Pontibacter anaerobius]MCX2739224.1 DUF4136 domain-containing protein [Pontibacter anaerobius]
MKRFFSLSTIPCLFLGLLYLSSCVTTSASMGAKSIKAPYASSLRTVKTYAWYQPEPPAEPEYLKGYKPALHRNLVQAIEQQLEKKGYTKAESNPDVLVAYDVSVSVPLEKDKSENFSEGFGYSYGYMSGYRYDYGHSDMPGYRSVDLFKEGTLIIDLIHPRSKMLLWRGWAEGAVDFNDGANAIENRVEEVLEQF